MKKEDLKLAIYIKTHAYEYRIPVFADCKIAKAFSEQNDNCDVIMDSYAVYKKYGNSFVYNEKMEKLYAFTLHYVVHDGIKIEPAKIGDMWT
jgi:flagellar biosynthesis protein FlhB